MTNHWLAFCDRNIQTVDYVKNSPETLTLADIQKVIFVREYFKGTEERSWFTILSKLSREKWKHGIHFGFKGKLKKITPSLSNSIGFRPDTNGNKLALSCFFLIIQKREILQWFSYFNPTPIITDWLQKGVVTFQENHFTSSRAFQFVNTVINLNKSFSLFVTVTVDPCCCCF